MMIATVFAWALLQEAPAQADVKAELAKALKAAAEAKSYAYKQTVEMEGSWGPSRGPMASEGLWQKDVGLSSKSEESEAYKVGDAVVYKGEDGEWKKVAERRPREEGGDRGNRGEGGDRGNRGGRGDWTSFRFRGLRAPHESLAGLDGKFKELKTEAEKVGGVECVVFTGPLTEAAIKEMSQRGGRGGDRQGEDMVYDGSAKVWVDDNYHIVKYVVETSVVGAMGDRPFSMASTRTVEFSKFDDAAVTVPEAAKKALEAKEEPPKEKSP